jgi:hypothetical protein
MPRGNSVRDTNEEEDSSGGERRLTVSYGTGLETSSKESSLQKILDTGHMTSILAAFKLPSEALDYQQLKYDIELLASENHILKLLREMVEDMVLRSQQLNVIFQLLIVKRLGR